MKSLNKLLVIVHWIALQSNTDEYIKVDRNNTRRIIHNHNAIRFENFKCRSNCFIFNFSQYNFNNHRIVTCNVSINEIQTFSNKV